MLFDGFDNVFKSSQVKVKGSLLFANLQNEFAVHDSYQEMLM